MKKIRKIRILELRYRPPLSPQIVPSHGDVDPI